MTRSSQRTLCGAGLALVFSLSCNTGLETGGGDDSPDMSVNPGACGVSCPAPLVCSKAGAGCIMPGTCGGDADCGMGQMCAAADGGAKVCVIGGKCGGQKIAAEAVPPNLLVVLDRSCSMQDKVGTSTKWDIAVAALNKLTTTYKDRIRFGLTLFPDRTGDNCAQDQIPIPVAPGNEAKMQSLLTKALAVADTYYPSAPCVTNIDTAVKQAAGEPSFKDATRASFSLLLTDGKQSSCNLAGGAAGAATIVGDLFQKQKVGTFVVGFGSGVDAQEMNTLAKAGGVPTGDPNTAYYKAEDQASLDKALAAIASQTLGCVFQLQTAPPNPQELYVFFDKARVPRDPNHKEGWDYDSAKKQVVFYGTACDNLRTGKIKVVDIVYGCDAPPLG